MSAAVRTGRALVLALVLGACGRDADVAQKLDVTARVAGDTWIAANAADRTELRVLIVGTPDSQGSTPFAFSSVHFPVSAGSTVYTLQGTWAEVGTAGATTLHVEHSYTLPDESSVGILSRRGAYRDDVRYDLHVTATLGAGQLVVTGSPDLAGTYVPLVQALGHLGTATARDAACAFQASNLGMRTSEARLIGFGGPGITQYDRAETYIGIVAGSLRISFSGSLTSTTNTTTIQYDAFEDVGGVRVDGPMSTYANSGGTGHMGGVMTFAFSPIAADGTPGATITGTIDYGGAGTAAHALQIVDGNPVGGFYTVAIDGGGTAQVPPATAPSPPLADCLALP